ncbi:hypothetical protein [Nocardiopsis sp. MG754419]|uniref:hypothetical protein n=1 Tax=Nocardiopsis sp. MG754419 TaxID=2259865 RepID=UPI001BA89DCA|nr:hypothetical protein [Nocardiopsis sp. MG754419]MBR8740616.1 hypothetical protein [Nocardiopsis sp. MG754419]
MSFHSPGRPDDLPEPSVIWAMAALSCAVSAGIGDFWPELRRLEDDGLYLDDGGGDWWRLTRVEGGRYLLVGWDRIGDTHMPHQRPFDHFGQAPDWLPWAWVDRAEKRGEIGFAYWWDGAWRRVDYPAWVENDGLGIACSSLSSVDGALSMLADFVGQALADHMDDPDDLPADVRLAEAMRPVAEAAITRRIGVEDVREMARRLVGPFDADAAFAVLERAGLTLGHRVPPEVPAGTGRPVERRGPWAISGVEWETLVDEAARGAVELDRPEAPENDLLRDWGEWLRGLAAEHGGAVTHTITCGERVSGSSLEDSEGRQIRADGDSDRDAFELRGSERHPERGAWFFLRLRAGTEEVVVDRAYDHFPAWSGIGFASTPSIGDLRVEMDRRSPEWRPDWVWLLDEEIPHDPPTGPLVPPGVTGGPA